MWGRVQLQNRMRVKGQLLEGSTLYICLSLHIYFPLIDLYPDQPAQWGQQYCFCLWMLSLCWSVWQAMYICIYICHASVVYMSLRTCLWGIHAQPCCRLVACSYNYLDSVGLQDSVTPDSSNAWFGPNGSNSSFNWVCSPSWDTTALCCNVTWKFGWVSEHSNQLKILQEHCVYYTALLSACPLTVTVSDYLLTSPLKIL